MTDEAVDEDILPIADLSDGDGDGPPASRRVLGVLVAVLLAVGLAVAILQVAGGDDRTPAERLTAAPAAAAAAETFAYTIKVETSLGTMTNGLQIDGVADNDAKRSKATMDLLGRKIEIVSDGSTAYLRIPAEARGFSQGKGWMKLPTNALTAGSEASASPTASPLETFRQLAAAGSEIEKVGEEDVRGTSTTHFRTTLDLSKRAEMAPIASQLTKVPVDVWLDDHDRPLRYRFVMSLTQAGQQATITTTIESFDWGKPVDIEVPDPADVAEGDTNALAALFGGS